MPVLPYPVTKYDTVYTSMRNFQRILHYLTQSKMPVTCDEGVYHIAREIQLICPGEFNDIILCPGPFHMAKVTLGCLGKYLKGSGAENILIESSVFGVNVIESVFRGSNYNRSFKGMQLLKEALCRLQWKEFFESDEKLERYRIHLELIEELKDKITNKLCDESAVC